MTLRLDASFQFFINNVPKFARQYTDELGQYREQCNSVLTEVNNALDYLKQLSGQYVHVSTKTNALHEECEHLLAEQVI